MKYKGDFEICVQFSETERNILLSVIENAQKSLKVKESREKGLHDNVEMRKLMLHRIAEKLEKRSIPDVPLLYFINLYCYCWLSKYEIVLLYKIIKNIRQIDAIFDITRILNMLRQLDNSIVGNVVCVKSNGGFNLQKVQETMETFSFFRERNKVL